MQIAISGASGFLGTHLTRHLAAAGHVVRPLVRGDAGMGRMGAIPWDPLSGALEPQALANVDAVVHLAGEPIDRRWTAARRRRILESRVQGTGTIARAMAAVKKPGMVLLSMSGINVYGNRGDEVLDEQSGMGTDFLARVSVAWERASDPARDAGVRAVQLRTSMVVATGGGGLRRMLPFFRAGVGGPMGGGRQWMSWIALQDYLRCVEFLLGAGEAHGPVNVTAPHPVRNGDFARALGRALRRPAVLPLPALALDALFGAMARGTVLSSQRALPRRLGELGFEFHYPMIAEALAFELARRG